MLHRIVAALSPGLGIRTALVGVWTAVASLVGCQQVVPGRGPSQAVVAAPDSQTVSAPAGVMTGCALGGAAWSEACVVERHGAGLVVTHPTGAFRRIAILDGTWRGEGADPIVYTSPEWRVGGDRFRLPASATGPGHAASH